jgi:cobalt-zinc-cadmium efflux system membrane fusion protein
MTSLRTVFVLACVLASACGRRPEPTEQAAAPAAKPAAAGEHADEGETHAGGTEVHVEASMLRDLRITTAKVESRQGGEQVTLLGELAVDEGRYAEVGSPVPARITRLLAGPGDAVKAGQPLLELQSADVGRARADYLNASAQLALAESALRRKRDLVAERIAPQREVQEAEAAVSAARAQQRAAAAALHAQGVGLPDSGGDDEGSALFTLKAPVAGTVIERRAVRGQMLEPGTTAFRIADLSTLWLTVHAFERDAVRIQPGTAARVSFAALPAQTFPGKVTLVGGEVSSESRTVDVRIEVRNRDGLLRPGMSASAALPIGASREPILAVPIAAVQRVNESWSVFVPKAEPGAFEIRRIGRGRDLGTEVEILSGLTAADTIVVDGAFLLKSQAEKSDAGHDDH